MFNQQRQQQRQQTGQARNMSSTPTRSGNVPIAKKDSYTVFGPNSSFANKGSVMSQEEKIPIKNKEDRRINRQQPQNILQDQTEASVRENEELKRQLVDAQRLADTHNENDQQHAKTKKLIEAQDSEWKDRIDFLENLCETQKHQIEELELQKETGCEQAVKLQESREQIQELQDELEYECAQKQTLRYQLDKHDQQDVTNHGSNQGGDHISPILIDVQSSQEQLVVESQRDLNTLFQQMEDSRLAAFRAQTKLVQQIKRSNEFEEKLDNRQKLVDQLTQEKSNLRDKLEYQIQATTRAQVQVTELEDITSTQQIQIESLVMVNRELQKKCFCLARTDDGENNVAGGSLGYVSSDDSLESLAQLDEPRKEIFAVTVDSKAPSQIEELQHNWDEQRAQIANIQQDQSQLFKKLGKFNMQYVSKINELCASIEKLSPQLAGKGGSESLIKHSTGLDLPQLREPPEKLNVIHEMKTKEIDGLTLVSDDEKYELAYDDSKLEAFETTWMQKTSEIESIQRDQEELLSRIRASSSEANTSLSNLSFSIEEDTHVNPSKCTLKKDMQALCHDNKYLLRKLREAEAMNASHIQNLEEGLEAKEHHNTCQNLESSNQALLSEKNSLLGKIGGLKDLLLETENICKNQKLSLERLEQDKESQAREKEVWKSALEMADTIAKHQRESMDCLRNEKQTLEQALDDHKLRTTEVEAVYKFQKAMITGLQAEKAALTKRLLDTEEEFRKHLSGNLSILAQMAELRSNIGHAIGPGEEEKAYSRKASTNESEEVDTSMESSCCDDDGAIFSPRVLDPIEKSCSMKEASSSTDKPVTVAADIPAAEEILRLLSFAE